MPEGIWAAVFISLWAMLLSQSALLVVLSRQMRRLHAERGPDAASVGLALGALAPEITVTDIRGHPITPGGPAPRRRLVVFLSPGCAGCRRAIRELQRFSPRGAQMILIWSADEGKTRGLAEEYQLDMHMVPDVEMRLWKSFMITGVPFAMLIDEEGRVAAKAFAGSMEQFEALLAPREARGPAEAGHAPSGREPASAD